MTTQTITAIRPKRSYTPNRAPLPTELIEGELFVNVEDKTIYIRHDTEDSVVLLSSQDGGQSATYTDLANLEGAEHAGRVMISNGNGTFKFEEIEFTQNINNVTEEYITNNITQHYNTVTNPTNVIEKTIYVKSEFDKLMENAPPGSTFVIGADGKPTLANLNNEVPGQLITLNNTVAETTRKIDYSLGNNMFQKVGPGYYYIGISASARLKSANGVKVVATVFGANEGKQELIVLAKQSPNKFKAKPVQTHGKCGVLQYQKPTGREIQNVVWGATSGTGMNLSFDNQGSIQIRVFDYYGNPIAGGIEALSGCITIAPREII